ncbi:MAG: phage holin family protein [Elusimicrobia bacterium]|nr:phage holin family protein [Elusimicrobiota bacterium]
MLPSEEPFRSRTLPVDLMKDHLELALLEWRYEWGEARRRVVAWGAGLLLAGSSAVLLHVALIGWAMKRGMGGERVALALAVAYLLIGAAVVGRWGRRRPGAGRPFEASREELNRSVPWIIDRFF